MKKNARSVQPLLALTRKERDSGVKSIRKAIRILTAIAESDSGIGLVNIAAALSMPKPSAHRILTTLEEMNCVAYDQTTRLWALDFGAFALGGPLQRPQLARLLRPYLQRVSRISGETVNLYVRQQWEVLCLDQIVPSTSARAMGAPGSLFPLHCSAAGKVVLAYQSPQAVSTYIRMRGLSRRTGRTIATSSVLERDLRWTRLHGCATDLEEHDIGLRCIALPIKNEASEVAAAVSVSGPACRMSSRRMDKLKSIIADVLRGLPPLQLAA